MAHIRLHVRQADGNLPMVCMRCGDPATVVKPKTLSWFPRWTFVLVLAHIVVFVIVAAILTRRARLQAPFCEQHQGHWFIRRAIVWSTTLLMLAVGGGLIFALIGLDNAQGRQGDLFGVLCVGSLFFFVAWIIVLAITQAVSIRADEITYTHISLTGVSEAFVQAVEEAEIERRVRLRQWQEEDEDERWSARREDEPARPHRTPASDAIEEERPPRSTPPSDAFEA